MEWTKETLELKFIRITSERQMKRAIKFFHSHGIEGSVNLEKRHINPTTLIMVIHGELRVGIGSIFDIQEIKIPSTPRRKFPREMMVSDDGIKWQKRLVAGTINSSSKYVSYINEEFQEGQVFKFLLAWKYAKEID